MLNEEQLTPTNFNGDLGIPQKIEMDFGKEKGARMPNQSKKMSAKKIVLVAEPVVEPVENEPVESENEEENELVESGEEEETESEGEDADEDADEDTDEEAEREAEAKALKEAEEMERKAKEAKTRLADQRQKQAEKKMLKLKKKAEEENNEEHADEIARIERLTKKLAQVEVWKKELAELKAKVASGLREKQTKHGVKPPPQVFAVRGKGEEVTQQSSYKLNEEECREFFNTDTFEEGVWFIKVSGQEWFLSWSEADKVFFFADEVPCGPAKKGRVLTDLSAGEVLKLSLPGATNSINALVKKIFGQGANANFRKKVRNHDILKKFANH
jgi:chemotaxis protein histidine kinase CheA